MRKLLSLLAALVLCSVLAVAQTRVVTGKITDDKGDPVPFATVTIKGTTNAAVADQTGSFSLKAKAGDVLVVTAQGMDSREATVGSDGGVSVALTRANAALTEVVVTGAYNTKRTARSVSYNAQVVNSEQLNTIRQTNVNAALAGKVSGIQFRGQSTAKLGEVGSVRLRGESGLGGGEGIIYVVDGTILTNANDINVDDIEDVSVLQGPAAAAQFGSQGANGAIVITLKKARKGAKGIGLDINLGAQWDKAYILPNYQNTYAGGANADMIRYDWQPGHPEEWKALSGKYYHDYSDDASWGPKMVGQEYIPWYAWYSGTKYSNKTAFLNPQEDNARDFFSTGVILNNSVAVSKATDVMNLRFSYGNVDVKGLLPETGLRKNTFNLNSTFDLNQHFTVGANINYITQNVNGEFDDAYSNQSTGSFNQWFHRDLDMNIMRELKDLRTPDGIYASWNHNNPGVYNTDKRSFYAGNYWYNFFTWFDLVKPVRNNDRLFGDVSLTYKFNNDFRVRGTYRKQQNNQWIESRYSSDLATSGTQTTGNCAECRGYYLTDQTNSNRENLEFLASYSKKIKDISFNANVGADFFRWNYKRNRANTVNGLNVPNLFSITNSKDQPSLLNQRLEEKYRAVFVKGDIGWRNLVFADFTLRNDWYSTLPPDNNDVLSKSVGVSFVFSDLLKIPAISFGKLRASWGEIPQALGTNSNEFGAYRYPGNQYNVNANQWAPGVFLMNATNVRVDSAIRGAVKSQKEIGLDMKFLKNRAGFSVTYWDATEKEIPREVNVDPTNGITSILINTGEITKKGIDVQLNVRPIWNNNFRWELNATWGSLLENKVVKIADSTDRIIIEGLWGATGTNAPVLVHAVGKDWGQIYGNGIKRINGQPVLNDEGFYVNDPAVYYGGVLPKYTGGIQNMIEYKGFVLAANIDYQVGGKFFSLSDMWGSYSGLTARTAVSNDKGNPIRDAVADGGGIHVFGVDKDGKPVDKYVEAQEYFHNLYNNKVFDEFVYDLTFVKLREVSLGYQIPVNKIGNLGKWMTRATFSVVARNPWLIHAKTKDFDPSEISNISGETGNLPGTRGFGFNLRVSL